jgi:hypothetical protein
MVGTVIDEALPSNCDELVRLLRELAIEIHNGADWENVQTDQYLEALYAYCRTLGVFTLADVKDSKAKPWSYVGFALLGAGEGESEAKSQAVPSPDPGARAEFESRFPLLASLSPWDDANFSGGELSQLRIEVETIGADERTGDSLIQFA